jgi:glycosyltransferase involved in cell wall biosynthesis
VTLHNAPPVGGGALAAVSWVLERLVAQGADDVLVVSPDLGVRARARGAGRVTPALVPAPPRAEPEPDARRAVRQELGVTDGEFLIVTAARLAPQKGLSLLADALWLLRVRTHGPVVTAVVAGDGPQRAALEADAAARRLPLRLLGDRDDVPRLFAAADATVTASVWEGQSLAVQEALRAGVPIVATDVGGNREVTGDAAMLIPRTTPEESARALAEAVASIADSPELAADLRRRALQRASAMPTEADAVQQVRGLLDTPRT